MTAKIERALSKTYKTLEEEKDLQVDHWIKALAKAFDTDSQSNK